MNRSRKANGSTARTKVSVCYEIQTVNILVYLDTLTLFNHTPGIPLLLSSVYSDAKTYFTSWISCCLLLYELLNLTPCIPFLISRTYSDAMTQDLATCMPLDELEQDLKSMGNNIITKQPWSQYSINILNFNGIASSSFYH